MQRYQAAWLGLTRWVTMAGVCAAVVVLPLRGLAIAFLVFATLGSTASLTWGGRRGARRLARIGIATGSAVLAVCASVVLFGPAGVLPPVVLALSAPPLLMRLSRLLTYDGDGVPDPRSATRYPPGELAAVVQWATEQTLAKESWATDPPADMDPATLCWAWRRSYLILNKPLSLASRTLVVKRRQELLDELEQCNPAGFAAWLDSGARAAGDPQRFILSRGQEPHR